MAIDSNHLPALVNKSLLLSQTGDAAGAEKTASLAAAIAPRDWRPWMARAEAAFAKGDSQAALSYLDQAAAADPSSPWPLVRKGLATMDGPLAEAAFRAALDRDPDTVEAHVGLAALAARKQDYAQAVAVYRNIVRLQPDDPQAHTAAAGFHVLAGQRNEAIAEYRRSLELAPQDGIVMHRLAQLLRDEGELAEAEALLLQAVAQVPAALFDLGDTLQRAGQSGRARDAYVQFLAKEPDSPYRPIAEAQLKRLTN